MRTIARGCPTLLTQPTTLTTAPADFSLVTPNPRNERRPAIAEKACGQQGTGDGGTPNTKIKKRPEEPLR